MLPITEKQLANLWERRAARSADLHTDKGARVRVLYPGRPGVTAGPDFRDALLLVEGQGLVHGDVEVHLRQRDWRAHRHQHDPNYNGVALHVALEPDAAPAVTHSGVAPPVVGLRSLLDIAGDESADGEAAQRLWRMLSQYGYQRPNSADQMAALLNRAGDERFLSRSILVRNSLETESPDQILWEAILRALGYRHNQHAMVELAGAVPIGKLTHAVRDIPAGERIEALRGWLMIWAGLNAGAGRPVWWPPSGLGAPLDKNQWRLFRVRPANHPARRLAGAAALVDRYSVTGLVAGLWRAASSGDAFPNDRVPGGERYGGRKDCAHWRRQGARHRGERSVAVAPRLALGFGRRCRGTRHAESVSWLQSAWRERDYTATGVVIARTLLGTGGENRPTTAGFYSLATFAGRRSAPPITLGNYTPNYTNLLWPDAVRSLRSLGQGRSGAAVTGCPQVRGHRRHLSLIFWQLLRSVAACRTNWQACRPIQHRSPQQLLQNCFPSTSSRGKRRPRSAYRGGRLHPPRMD